MNDCDNQLGCCYTFCAPPGPTGPTGGDENVVS